MEEIQADLEKQQAAKEAQTDLEKQQAVEGAQMDLEKQEVQAEGDLRLEEVLTQVEQCIAQLEDPQISLEDSFRCYEEGIRKLKICKEKVDQIEKKMLMINERGELEEIF